MDDLPLPLSRRARAGPRRAAGSSVACDRCRRALVRLDEVLLLEPVQDRVQHALRPRQLAARQLPHLLDDRVAVAGPFLRIASTSADAEAATRSFAIDLASRLIHRAARYRCQGRARRRGRHTRSLASRVAGEWAPPLTVGNPRCAAAFAQPVARVRSPVLPATPIALRRRSRHVVAVCARHASLSQLAACFDRRSRARIREARSTAYERGRIRSARRRWFDRAAGQVARCGRGARSEGLVHRHADRARRRAHRRPLRGDRAVQVIANTTDYAAQGGMRVDVAVDDRVPRLAAHVRRQRHRPRAADHQRRRRAASARAARSAASLQAMARSTSSASA